MITSAIFYILMAIYGLLTAVLPTGSLPAAITTSFQTILDTMHQWNSLLPINDLLIVFGLVLTFEFYMFLIGVFEWFYVKLWGSR